MQNLSVLEESETFVWAREKDQIRALGLLLMLSSIADTMMDEPLMSALERHQAAIAREQYFILYERRNKDTPLPVPVAFVTWAFLSRPAGVIFEKRLRPLNFTEFNSGNHLWVIDVCANFGHSQECMQQFRAMFREKYREFYATRPRDGQWRKETHMLRKE